MNRFRVAAAKALAALALCASLAPRAAASDTVLRVIDKDYIWQIKGSSFTSVTSKTVDPCGYGSVGFSSVTANCIGFSYDLYAVGAGATYQIVQTTKTPNTATNPVGFNSPAPMDVKATVAVLSTGTTLSIPASVLYDEKFEAPVINPVFYFTNLSNAATYYLNVKYGIQRKP